MSPLTIIDLVCGTAVKHDFCPTYFLLYNMVQLEKNTFFRSLCYDRQEKHQRREKKMTIKEFIKKSRLKTWDVIIIAILVLGSFRPLLFLPCKTVVKKRLRIKQS